MQHVDWVAGHRIKYNRSHYLPGVDDPTPETTLFVCDSCGSLVAADHEWKHRATHDWEDQINDRVCDVEDR